MWGGIIVQTGGRLIINKGITHDNTLIEDADIAIKMEYVFDLANLATTKALTIDYAIFNRNRIGVDFTGSENTTGLYSNLYPIAIQKSIFTCRDIPFKPGSNTTGTNTWVSFVVFKKIVASGTTPQSMSSPYIDDKIFSPTNDAAYLKASENVHTKSEIGIETRGKVISHGTYQIGNETLATNGKNDNVLIFDNQTIGIHLKYADARVTNCTFQNTPGANPIADTYGLQAEQYDETAFHLDTRVATGKPHNAFFDCRHAINSNFYTNLYLYYNDIRSSKTAINGAVEGFEGITAKVSDFFYERYDNSAYINFNNITNIANGITVRFGNYPFTNSSNTIYLKNKINVNDNLIASYPAWSATGVPGYFVDQAINFEVIVSPTISATGLVGLLCNRNTINLAYNGIRFSNWKGKNMRIINNRIVLFNPNSTATTVRGISFDGCVPQAKYLNFIYGNQINCQPYIHTYSATGMAFSNGTNYQPKCNVSDALNMHFLFSGSIAPVNWVSNKINTSTAIGFSFSNNAALVLNSGGYIGSQGTAVANGGTLASDNEFGSVSLWTAGNGNYHTRTNFGSNATLSPLLVQKAFARYNPSNNFTLPGSTIYSYINNSLRDATASNETCPVLNNKVITLSVKEQEYQIFEDYPELHEEQTNEDEIADTTLPMTVEDWAGMIQLAQGNALQTWCDEPELMQYVAQMDLYNWLLSSDNITTLDPLLQNFIDNSNAGSFGTINQISLSIQQGHYDTAAQLLNNWNPTNRVDENYAHLLGWAIQWGQNQIPDLGEIANLATKCPQTDGNVVFAAQNLYNDITNEHRLFVTNCDADNSQNIAYRGIKPVEKVQEKLGKLDNRIEVYPNPSTNIITVKGDGFKRIELINAYGAIIYSNGNISGNTITINLNKYSSGLYYLRITETNNATTTRKIIKNLN